MYTKSAALVAGQNNRLLFAHEKRANANLAKDVALDTQKDEVDKSHAYTKKMVEEGDTAAAEKKMGEAIGQFGLGGAAFIGTAMALGAFMGPIGVFIGAAIAGAVAGMIGKGLGYLGGSLAGMNNAGEIKDLQKLAQDATLEEDRAALVLEEASEDAQNADYDIRSVRKFAAQIRQADRDIRSELIG